MIKCPKCNEPNSIEARSCTKCGTAFFKPSQLSTYSKRQTIEFVPEKSVVQRLVAFFKKPESLNPPQAQPTPPPAPAQPPEIVPIRRKRLPSPPYIRDDYKRDYSYFVKGNTIYLRLGDEKIVINKVRRDILLGRVTKPTKAQEQYMPINLMKYVGARTGISRVHALLRPSNNGKLMLIDLNSTNGTKLNRRPCIPFKPYEIFSGDEIQLADVVLTIQFSQSRYVTSELPVLNLSKTNGSSTTRILTTKPLSPRLVEAPPIANSGNSK